MRLDNQYLCCKRQRLRLHIVKERLGEKVYMYEDSFYLIMVFKRNFFTSIIVKIHIDYRRIIIFSVNKASFVDNLSIYDPFGKFDTSIDPALSKELNVSVRTLFPS